MTILVEDIISALDDKRLPDPDLLAEWKIGIAFGIDRIDIDEFKRLLGWSGRRAPCVIAFAEWGSQFQIETCDDIDALWRRYVEVWTSDCIIQHDDVVVLQPGSDNFYMVLVRKPIASELRTALANMNKEFADWITSDENSLHAKTLLAGLKKRFSPAMIAV